MKKLLKFIFYVTISMFLLITVFVFNNIVEKSVLKIKIVKKSKNDFIKEMKNIKEIKEKINFL